MMAMSAQVSLYPLQGKSLGPAIDRALHTFRKHGLGVVPSSMSTVLTGDEEAIFAALREAYHAAAVQGEAVMVVTLSNACPVP